MSILLGTGEGTFRAGPAFPLTDQNVNNAAVADFWGRPFTPPPSIQCITTGPQGQPRVTHWLAGGGVNGRPQKSATAALLTFWSVSGNAGPALNVPSPLPSRMLISATGGLSNML